MKDLGCNDAELRKAVPNRSKRPLVIEDMPSKRQRVSKQSLLSVESNEEAMAKSNASNETFILKKLENVETVIDLVVSGMDSLPQEMPSNFLVDYTPIGDLTVVDQIKKTSKLLARQMSSAKVGPGACYLTVSPPPSPEESITKVEMKTDDSARHLKETLERMKGYVESNDIKTSFRAPLKEIFFRQREQSNKKKVKQQAKKLQDVSKPLSAETKANLLNQTVHRILQYDPDTKKNAMRKNKILAVIGSTFVPNVKKLILDFIVQDFKSRTFIALDWLYSEYCLLSGKFFFLLFCKILIICTFSLKGFIRSPYAKADQTKPDFNYNQLLMDLLSAISNHNDVREKQKMLQTVYLEAPLVTQDALKKLGKYEIILLIEIIIVYILIHRTNVRIRGVVRMCLEYYSRFDLTNAIKTCVKPLVITLNESKQHNTSLCRRKNYADL